MLTSSKSFVSLVGFALLFGISVGGPVDSVVAEVGETVILESELEQAEDFVRIAMRDTVQPDSALRAQVLKQLVDNELLQEQAKRDTIVVTREEVASLVDADVKTLRDRFESEEKFQAALLSEGMTERSLRLRYENDVRRRLLSRRLLEKAGLTATYVSPAEAKRFYNENRDSIALVPGHVTLAHVLIAVIPSAKTESLAMHRAGEVLDILSRGGDFAIVASSFSDDKNTSTLGGDWDWKGMDEIPTELALVLSQLKPGQISPPFRSPEGYMTAKLEAQSGDKVRFRTILIRVPLCRADTLRALARARSIRKKAAQGLAFDSLAHEFSYDPVTRDSGGFLGEFLLEGLAPPFDSVVAALDSGDISEPVLSEHGFHIIRVIDKKPERTMSYLEMQDMVRNYLQQEKFNQRLQRYLARIAKEIYIKRFN